MNTIPYEEYLEPCCAIAREAGELIMGYFARDFATQHKPDESPVTDADFAANRFIVAALAKLTPDIPIIAEEDEALNPGGHACFWLVDPLDGTRSFVRGETEFTVNIGLIEKAKPVLGVISSPPQEMLYFGIPGHGAFRQKKGRGAEPINTRLPPTGGMTVTRSRSTANTRAKAFLETLDIRDTIACSSAIKFCHVAEGIADLYPRMGRTMEWDTAAGHAILNAAGGRLETTDGKPFLYGKPGFENPPFIAYGR